MCLISTTIAPRIISEDMEVYKILMRDKNTLELYSPSYTHIWKLGQIYTIEDSSNIVYKTYTKLPYTNFGITKGVFHSVLYKASLEYMMQMVRYNAMMDNFYSIDTHYTCICSGIIPKGSNVWEDTNGICIASSSLIVNNIEVTCAL